MKKVIDKKEEIFLFFDTNLTQDEGNRYFNFEFEKYFKKFH